MEFVLKVDHINLKPYFLVMKRITLVGMFMVYLGSTIFPMMSSLMSPCLVTLEGLVPSYQTFLLIQTLTSLILSEPYIRLLLEKHTMKILLDARNGSLLYNLLVELRIHLGDFISFVAMQDFILPLDLECLWLAEVDIITEHFLLAAYADPSQFSCIQHFDPSTAPDMSTQVITRPDTSVWHEAMKHEVDSLEEYNMFK